MMMKFVLALTLVLGTVIAKAEEYRICPSNSNVMCGKENRAFCIDTHDKKVQMRSAGIQGTTEITVKKENFEGDLPGELNIKSEDLMTGSYITKLNLKLVPVPSKEENKLFYDATISGEVNKTPLADETMPCTTI
jgi:hypothetical protein